MPGDGVVSMTGWPDGPGKRDIRLSVVEEELVELTQGVRVIETGISGSPYHVQRLRLKREDETGKVYGASGEKFATPLEWKLWQILLGQVG